MFGILISFYGREFNKSLQKCANLFYIIKLIEQF